MDALSEIKRDIPGDALNQELNVGDTVAYVSRHGSSVYIRRRTITRFEQRDGRWHAVLDGKQARPCQLRNLIRVDPSKIRNTP